MSYLRMISQLLGQSMRSANRPQGDSPRQPLIESLEHRIVLNAATPAANWSDVYNDKTLPASALTQAPTNSTRDVVTPTKPLFTFSGVTSQGLPPITNPGNPIGAPPVYLPEPAELALVGIGGMLVLRRRRRLEPHAALDIPSER
jgi:hypothetical protein